MSATIAQGISHEGIFIEEFQFPWNLASGIVAADVGKAVAIDTGADTTVKLAGDGDAIIGRLETFEDRVVEGIKVGAVSHAGGVKFPYKTGETLARGNYVVGAGSGEVKAQAAQAVNEGGSANLTIRRDPIWLVTSVNTTAKTVTVIKI